MFWRKSRKAIDRFHPLHQGLIWQRSLSATMRPADWEAFINSLAQHNAHVKRGKWAPPPRTATVLVPLIRVLSEDIGPAGMLGITADLRGPGVPGKSSPQVSLPVRRPVRSATQWYTIDPWLRVRAELRDGSVLDLTITDRTRHRRIHKVNPRGKHKTKTKTKTVQRISASRTLRKGAGAHRPASPPPPWVRMQLRSGRRTVLRVGAKLSPAPTGPAEFDAVTSTLTELFRWTAPRMTA